MKCGKGKAKRSGIRYYVTHNTYVRHNRFKIYRYYVRHNNYV